MLYFANNTVADASDRLSKVQIIIDELNTNFRKYYDPPEVLCIDESLIPFRGRIIFRQYLKQKRRKYGTKIFKLRSGIQLQFSYLHGKGQVWTRKYNTIKYCDGFM